MAPIVRVITVVIIFGLVSSMVFNYSKSYNKNLENIAKWSVYNLELEDFGYCKKRKNEKISYVGSDIIILGKEVDGKYSFRMQKCIEKL